MHLMFVQWFHSAPYGCNDF